MTLTQLSYIIAVDKHRHFATAADKSFVTQPTLSMQIQKLEEELGIIIFDRSRSPVVPTEIGEKVIKKAKEILKESQNLRDITNFREDELRGTFKVGIISTIAPYLVPMFLRNFIQKHPHVDLIFEELLTNEVIDKIGNDELDAGIIATPSQQSYIYTEDLFVEPFVGYISQSHPISDKQKLTMDHLDSSSIWLLSEGHCFRDQTLKICRESVLKKNNAIQFNSGNLETLKQLVEQDFGMTLLPWTAIRNQNEDHSKSLIKEFEEPIPSRMVRLVYGRKHLKQNIIREFTETIQQSIPDVLKTSKGSVLIE